MSTGSNAPVIIKRKKVVAGDGHHGGAWKVAYADFVTAIMAFFMLMWLLNATTEKQRKGIADYFHPTIAVNRISGGGEGSFGGESVFSETVMAQNGTGASGRHASEQRQARGQGGLSQTGSDAQEQAMREALDDIGQLLMARAGESMVSDDILRHIVTRVTDEGLIVELFDLEGQGLFQPDTAQPTQVLTTMIGVIAPVFALVDNGVAIGGHTRAYARAVVTDPSWDLSTRRAGAVRDLLAETGLPPARIRRVTGHADRSPATPRPMAPRNNRIELILLRSDV